MGYVRPVLGYGITAWGTASDSNFNKLARIQNQNIRVITGAMRSTPIHSMETQTGLDSLNYKRSLKTIIQYGKFNRMPSFPDRKNLQESEQPAYLKEQASYTKPDIPALT